MRILGVGQAFPPHYYDQQVLLEALAAHLGESAPSLARLESFHRNVHVEGRHLALPIPEYEDLTTFGARNDAWIRVALDLGEAAIRDGLERAGVAPEEVGALLFTTVTGVATPSLDARLLNRLPLARDVRRVPLFGLGCVAGAAGLARLDELLRGMPTPRRGTRKVGVLLSVELCSLTLRRDDTSVPNLISSALFGDGAAALVLGEDAGRDAGAGAGPEGGPAPTPEVVASRSVFYPESEEVMGWSVSEEGLGIVLSAEVPSVVRAHLAHDVDAFLGDEGLSRADIESWIAHPGGPKVLEAMESCLELDPDALALTWESLGRVGNLSSTSVLVVLRETLARRRVEPGRHGLMIAMGPGFCAELVLLRW